MFCYCLKTYHLAHLNYQILSDEWEDGPYQTSFRYGVWGRWVVVRHE